MSQKSETKMVSEGEPQRAGSTPLLDVKGLSVELVQDTHVVPIVEDLSFEIGPGEFFALVGESGSGKSVTCLALMNLLANNLRAHGNAYLGSQVLFGGGSSRRKARANMAMIFQNATQCLNPVRTIGFQLIEALGQVQGRECGTARQSAKQLLREVGLRDPDRLLASYPHQLSGGMNQRIMIAMALAARPTLLIADEPTSSLDVTMQAQILDLIDELKADRRMSILFITHDLAVAAERADRIGVLYAGRMVEYGTAREVFGFPRHRYTTGLLASLLRFNAIEKRLTVLEGNVPLPGVWPDGCRFAQRCVNATYLCRVEQPSLRGDDQHRYACHHPTDQVA